MQGNWVHRRGAATAKALSPLDVRRERGIDKRALSEDLKDLVDDRGVRISLRYDGT